MTNLIITKVICQCGHKAGEDNIYAVALYDNSKTVDICDSCCSHADLVDTPTGVTPLRSHLMFKDKEAQAKIVKPEVPFCDWDDFGPNVHTSLWWTQKERRSQL
jgi:hypothetical protein